MSWLNTIVIYKLFIKSLKYLQYRLGLHEYALVLVLGSKMLSKYYIFVREIALPRFD